MLFITFVWKNLFRRKTRSLATVIGVAIAVGAMVALVGMSEGFEKSFAQIFEDQGADLLVLRAGVTQRLTSILDESIGERLAKLPGVARVVGGMMDVASFEEGSLIGVSVNGVPFDSPMVRNLTVLEGRKLRQRDAGAVMLGKILARRLGKKPGDRVEMETEDFQVVGVYESNNVYENGAVVMLLSEMQRLMDRPGKVSGFMVIMEDSEDQEAAVRALCEEIKQLRDENGRHLNLDALPTSDYASTTIEIRTVKAMAWGTSTIALVIGAVAMFNTMMMSVFERTTEIGILRAIGWSRTQIVSLIFCESLLLSTVGAIVGAVGAMVVVALLGEHPRTSGFIAGNIAGAVVAQGMCLGLFVGAVAGLFPAIRAAGLLPTEAIRHE